MTLLYWRKPDRDADIGLVVAEVHWRPKGFVTVSERDCDGMPICWSEQYGSEAAAISWLRANFAELGYQEIDNPDSATG